jgi:hypothetical protein
MVIFYRYSTDFHHHEKPQPAKHPSSVQRGGNSAVSAETFGSQLSGPFMDQHISDVTSFWSTSAMEMGDALKRAG